MMAEKKMGGWEAKLSFHSRAYVLNPPSFSFLNIPCLSFSCWLTNLSLTMETAQLVLWQL